MTVEFSWSRQKTHFGPGKSCWDTKLFPFCAVVSNKILTNCNYDIMLGWVHLPRFIFYINHLLITLLTKTPQLCKPFCVCLVSQNSLLAIKQASLCRYIRVCQARFVFLLLANLMDMWSTQQWSEKVNFSFSEAFWDEVKATVKLSFYSLSGNYITTLRHAKLLHQHTLHYFGRVKQRECVLNSYSS